jgi:hypothetical protein
MTSSDTIASYLMRITQISDQLAAIGEVVDETELVNMALNGFLGSWEPFVHERSCHHLTDCGLIASRRRLGRVKEWQAKR